MSIFSALTSIPYDITQGEAVTWAETLTDYPGATHSVAYKFAGQTPLDGFQQFSVSGAETDTATYTFTIPATVKPGAYSWEKQITLTAGSVMRVVEHGRIVVKPSASGAQTSTFAAQQVSLLKSVLAAFNATDKQSVNFNGQSFTRFAISDYQKQLTYWEACVIAEQSALASLGRARDSGRIAIRFV